MLPRDGIALLLFLLAWNGVAGLPGYRLTLLSWNSRTLLPGYRLTLLTGDSGTLLSWNFPCNLANLSKTHFVTLQTWHEIQILYPRDKPADIAALGCCYKLAPPLVLAHSDTALSVPD